MKLCGHCGQGFTDSLGLAEHVCIPTLSETATEWTAPDVSRFFPGMLTCRICGHTYHVDGAHVCPFESPAIKDSNPKDAIGIRKAPAQGIGDIDSDAKGSGARFNSGKPDLSLIPLGLLAEHHHKLSGADADIASAIVALRRLAAFQTSHDVRWLYMALAELGEEGWAECAEVFDYGRKKYKAWNWAKGMPWSVPLACGARHLVATIKGEPLDIESGKPHRGHVFCNVLMLIQYTHTFPEGNDLPPKGLL